MLGLQLAAFCVAAVRIMTADAYVVPRDIMPVLAGCGKPLPTGQQVGQVSNVTILSGGLERNYLIFIPPHYNAFLPTPVILSYHGGVRTAEDQLLLDQLTNPEFNTVSFVVYPQGIKNSWQGVPGVTIDDVQFTTDILNEIESLYCLDPSRISATGKSDGAGFCNVLACDPVLSKRVAAFAPVSGAYYVDTLPCYPTSVAIPCTPGRKDIPILAFHGGNDSTIAYSGGQRKSECLPAIPHFMQQWALRDGLSSSNVSSPLSSNTTIYSYGVKRGASLVEHIYDSAIGHDWPSTKPNADNQVSGHHLASFNATPIILDFFALHPLSIVEVLEEIF